MRRVIVVAAAIVGAVVIFAGAILFYAATNLNSIIAERRQTVLEKVSRALGRQVHADDIKVSLGWGIMADVTGVQVADDPYISNKPFIEADNVYTRLELIPLLARQIQVTEVVLEKPVIRIVQTHEGTFNLSTLGRKKIHKAKEQSTARRRRRWRTARTKSRRWRKRARRRRRWDRCWCGISRSTTAR